MSPRLSDDKIERLQQLLQKVEDARKALNSSSDITIGFAEECLQHAGDTFVKYAPALLTELQSLRAASEWRTDMDGAKSQPQDVNEIQISKAAFGGGWFYRTICLGELTYYIKVGWTHWKPITPPDSTNTDILAEMREREARLVDALKQVGRVWSDRKNLYESDFAAEKYMAHHAAKAISESEEG